MKKILLMLLPMLLLIALIFNITDRDFTSAGFLKFISELRFSNFIDTFNKTKENWSNMLNTFENLGTVRNPLDIIGWLENIGKGISLFVQSIYSFVWALWNLLYDIVVNVGNIVDYLFIS